MRSRVAALHGLGGQAVTIHGLASRTRDAHVRHGNVTYCVQNADLYAVGDTSGRFWGPSVAACVQNASRYACDDTCVSRTAGWAVNSN